MARWLSSVALFRGPAVASGALYRVDYYPGFVPGRDGIVTGALFELPDAAAILAVLDDHEECAAHFPAPHEFRRERIEVRSGAELYEAWTYVYARKVTGLERIVAGDFLT